MIFTPTGSFYSKVQFKTEEEVEKVVIDNFKLLFGDHAILLPKSVILTSGGKGSIPDGIIIDFEHNCWFILEVERGVHETWAHIAPQINKQLVAVKNQETKNKIIQLCLAEIKSQKSFVESLENDLKIIPIGIHGSVQSILEKDPIVSLPIDFSPSDLEDWADSLKVEVRIQHVEKYMDANGNILYNLPDVEKIQEKEIPLLSANVKSFVEAVKSGAFKVGDAVHFDYGPKGKPKTHFEGKICEDGIDVNGVVSSPSISAQRCIQSINPSRTTANGWTTWKTADGNLLETHLMKFLKQNGVVASTNKIPKHKAEKKAKKEFVADSKNFLFHFAKGGDITATIKRNGSKFVLLAGSQLSLDYKFSSTGWAEVRKNAVVSADGKLRKDIECDSSSMAAYLVAGGQRNGLEFWKDKNRKSLKELEK